MNSILSQISDLQFAGIGVVVLFFIVQLIYAIKFNRIAKHRHMFRLKNDNDIPPVSVIVIVENDVEYIYEDLPKLLAQDHPNYEVVVVNDCGGAEVTNALAVLSANNPKLRYTVIKPDDKFKHSRKIALVVGIKAARHNNLVITHTNIAPDSERWLTFMARGFVGSEIVISYAGFDMNSKFKTKLVRASWLKSSINYLNAAIKGKAYRGTFYNIGYTKDIFFKSRGYTHLRLALGEDDLFIQKIANKKNVAVIINPHTTVRMPLTEHGTIKWWWNYKKFHTYQFRYYPIGVKFAQFCEEFLKATYFIVIGAAISVNILVISGFTLPITFPIAMLCGCIGLAIIREIVLGVGIKKVCKRLGERKLVFAYMLNDKISPITSMALAIMRRVRAPQGIWR